jgi:hypothetical protein
LLKVIIKEMLLYAIFDQKVKASTCLLWRFCVFWAARELIYSQAANCRAQGGEVASVPQQNVLKLYLVKGFYQRNVVVCNFSIKK